MPSQRRVIVLRKFACAYSIFVHSMTKKVVLAVEARFALLMLGVLAPCVTIDVRFVACKFAALISIGRIIRISTTDEVASAFVIAASATFALGFTWFALWCKMQVRIRKKSLSKLKDDHITLITAQTARTSTTLHSITQLSLRSGSR